MKRQELTTKAMEDMGWSSVNPGDLAIKDIVFNIQEKNDDGTYFWKLRCVYADGFYDTTEFGMCSTYKVRNKKEYLEVSVDGKHWNAVASRYIEVARTCVYAD